MPLSKNRIIKDLHQALLKDRHYLKRMIRNLPEPQDFKFQNKLKVIERRFNHSIEMVEKRRSSVPSLNYPEELPISGKRDEIVAAIEQHQVVVITGETGSGKTTQIPKLCLDAGRGVYGKIACTQPRRIAATSLARRVAAELDCVLGEEIGYKIRFENKATECTLIQYMTDGVLLTETQRDRFLNSYDVIVIDEAHERTLNIDFLLGYLKQVLPKRPELKLIITSATIDVERFSQAFPLTRNPNTGDFHFKDNNALSTEEKTENAPIIAVSGRMYPVELRYSPIDEIMEDEGEQSMIDLVENAVEELLTETASGDILVFMSGVQEIREAVERLKPLEAEDFLILPLFGRLTNAEQNRIFNKSRQRKIILATNIAETSITVPGIKFVVDTGRARISQFNPRTGTQRLPVKAISQSSAEQRKGRCGRVSDGICLRLYSKEDYLLRDEYTIPEIQRSNLAEVILRMMMLRLGDIRSFPFIDPPENAQINSGYNILRELGAIDDKKRLTSLGREMASLPIDPRTARMVIQAKEENALYPVLVIAAAISCQDPRDMSQENRDRAAQRHASFVSKDSDLITMLNLWEQYHTTLDELKTQNKMRKFCKQNYLSYKRMREWRDIHRQLTDIAQDKKWRYQRPKTFDSDAIHRSILSGYLNHIAKLKEKKRYQGTKNREFFIFPGSGLGKSKHEWIVAIEMIETSQLFAHQVAKINLDWIEPLAGDLCRKSWSEPRWDEKEQRVVAWEKVSLFGFTLVEKRKVNYGNIDSKESTTIFIREALVGEQLHCRLSFWLHNRALIKEIRDIEDRRRKRAYLVDDYRMEQFYQKRLSNVYCLADLKREIKRQNGDEFLYMKKEDLLVREPESSEDLFPDVLTIGSKKCRLYYKFEPGHEQDGVTLELAENLLPVINPNSFEYLVPGFLQEKILFLLKSLPKEIRKKVVPVSETASKVWEEMISWRFSTEQKSKSGSPAQGFYSELSEILFKETRVDISTESWGKENLPEYLKMNFLVKKAGNGKKIQSRNFDELTSNISKRQSSWQQLVKPFEKTIDLQWDFGPLLEEIQLSEQSDIPISGYRSLIQKNEDLWLTVSKSLEDAEEQSLKAVGLLTERNLGEELSWLFRSLRFPPETLHHFENLWTGETNLAIDALQKKFGGSTKKTKAKFHEQLQQKSFEMVCQGLCGFDGSMVLHQDQFVKKVQAVRDSIQDLGSRVVKWIEETMSLRHQALVQIQKRKIVRRDPAWDIIADELGFFISEECLKEIPLEQWRHCPRIMSTYIRRIEKYSENPAVESERMELVEPYQGYCRDFWVDRNQAGIKQLWDLKKLRWMVEEYKVSVFAQDLKTAFPISPKRIDKFIRDHQ
jgi:ATP-dependent helicase HrpA